ncbi:MAG: GGDEF domain-containing protein [Gammaproteobacteria bacterium]|nr:GGDEF domain-containing protein [Gammaproteobacteria bacterium]|tara:strand:- start:1266 stop:1877 length:612 start_codon:yes stop_codon:yes gene_type:complete
MNQVNAKDPCPAGSEVCTNIVELQRLREEITYLASLVRTDELTGLYNYRYFYQTLSLEMERVRRSGQPASLIMCDLDHFKSINDIYGHEVGNLVLSHIASLIQKAIRRLDIPCRYGGEEFAIILPDTALPQGVRLANRLRLIVGKALINAGDLVFGVEASFGVATYARGDCFNEKEFVDMADGYLYMAKQQGRNCVCHTPFDE